jgi:hypothetical protein
MPQTNRRRRSGPPRVAMETTTNVAVLSARLTAHQTQGAHYDPKADSTRVRQTMAAMYKVAPIMTGGSINSESSS